MVQTPAVYGDITPQDDFTHPLGPEKNFNESMYFNFFDAGQGLGGFLRIGNRANEGYAEVTLNLYLPGGPVLFNYRRPEIHTNDAFDAGGMRFETIEPLARLRTMYEGGAVYLTDPTQLTDPGQAFRSNPHRNVSLDLLHEAVGPAYGSTGAEAETDPEKGFARAHYEQHMRVTGVITIDGREYRVAAFGLRDHSWGPRYWQSIHSYRWLTCSFGPELNIMVSEVTPTPGSRNQGGVVIRDGVLNRITSFELESSFQPGTRFHTGMRARLMLDSGETVDLSGRVVSFVPLRNRREGMVTHIGEGMTEYECLGRRGLGISEYLDQVQ
jgi:hypothetical protein